MDIKNKSAQTKYDKNTTPLGSAEGQQLEKLNINDANLPEGWEWLVLKLRSRRVKSDRTMSSRGQKSALSRT
jgi:hypothetical protein